MPNKKKTATKTKPTNPVVMGLKSTAKSLRETAKHLTATANQLAKMK